MADESLQDRLRAVQSRLSQAQAQRTRAEVEKENAERSLAEAKARLSEEFNISTGEDLRRVRGSLEEEFQKTITDIEKSLEDATEG